VVTAPATAHLELPEHGVLRVLVDARLVGNILRPVGISQRAECLLIVPVSWADVGHHDGLGVATQAVLQQPSQLGVPGGTEAAGTSDRSACRLHGGALAFQCMAPGRGASLLAGSAADSYLHTEYPAAYL
jgi:hypothetical protein